MASPRNCVGCAFHPQLITPNRHRNGPICGCGHHIRCVICAQLTFPRGRFALHNQRNRRAAKAKPADSPAPAPRVAPPSLFAVPTVPCQAKPARRKAAKRKSAKRKFAKTKVAAIALPQMAEPLVTTGQALVPYRPGGLIGQLNHWLGGRVTQVWRRLSGLGQGAPKPRHSSAQIRQLRAENARLKAQLEALLALQPALPPGARDRALQPLR